MLSDREFLAHCEQLGLPPGAISHLLDVRASDPARAVGEHARNNVRCRFASTKNGHSVSVESRSCELAFALRLELNPNVLEFYAQPFTAIVARPNHGVLRRLHLSPYTPDFLVVGVNRIKYVECRPVAALERICIAKPTEWTRVNREYRFRPAEEFFGRLSLPFEVWPAPSRSGVLNANLETMAVLYNAPAPEDDASALAKARRALGTTSLTLADLCDEVPGVDDSQVIRWIALGELFSCLRVQLLEHGLTTHVFADRAEALSRQKALFEASAFFGRKSDEITVSRLLSASPVDFAIAVERAEQIMPVLNELRGPTRNERRFLEPAIEAFQKGESIAEAVVPKTSDRGNRDRRLTEFELKVIAWAIKKVKRLKRNLTPKNVLAKTDRVLGRLKRRLIGAESVRLAVAQIPIEDIAMARGGNRARNQVRPPHDPREKSLRTEIPGKIGHVDSSQWDQRLWEALPWSDVLPCPWWYVAYDEACLKAIGVSLSLTKSDQFGLSLLWQDVGETIGFLPNYVVHDRGAEFGSGWWQKTGAETVVHQLDRASGDPRAGAQVEGPIGIAIRQFARELAGSTELDKAGRSADGRKKSRHYASFQLVRCWSGLRGYLMGHFNNDPHGTASGTPDDLWALGRRTYPLIGRKLPPPRDWDVMTAIPIKDRVTISLKRGIETYYRRFSSPDLISNLRSGKPEQVKLSAKTPTLLYAKFGNRWVSAFSGDHASSSTLGLSQQSAEIIVLRDRQRVNREARRANAAKLDKTIDALNYRAAAEKTLKQELANQQTGAPHFESSQERPDPLDDIDWDFK